MPTKGWPRGSVLGGWGGAARGRIGGVALAVGRGLAAYGFSSKNDPLAQLLALNPEFARREQAGEPVTAPGIPPAYPDPDTDREIRARFDRQASATKQRPLSWSLPILMRKTVFFFVSFHRRAMQAWVLFLVSIERGTPMPDLSLPSLAV